MTTSALSSQASAAGTASEIDSTTAPCLVAVMDNAKIFYNLLKAIHFRDRAVCVVTQSGFKFTVEEAKSVQAHAYLQAGENGVFKEFAFTEEELVFGISLNVLTDCLNILNLSSHPVSVRISCLGQGHPLVLVMDEHLATTKCKISTLEPDALADFDFKGSPVKNKIIMKSEWLKEAFDDIDDSSEFLSILVSPVAPYLRLSTQGSTGSTDIDYPKENDVIESFQCQQTEINSYRLSMLQPSVKAIAQSKKLSLRMNERGVLSMQFMIPATEVILCFVEYFCVPLELNNGMDE